MSSLFFLYPIGARLLSFLFMRKVFFIIALLMAVANFCSGQQHFAHYAMNTGNGLPSDRVYGITTDHLGYLWFCTDKGVVRYNGYTYKYFTVSDGLPTDDVWQLVEDKMGRMWLGAISDEVGYLANNKYHKAYIPGQNTTIYPAAITARDSGIFFTTQYDMEKKAGFMYWCNSSDTFKVMPIVKDYFKQYFSRNDNYNMFVARCDEYGQPFFTFGNSLFSIVLPDDPKTQKPIIKKYATINVKDTGYYYRGFTYVTNQHMLTGWFTDRQAGLDYCDIRNGHFAHADLKLAPKDYPTYIFVEKRPNSDNYFYAITNKEIIACHLDTGFHIVERSPVSDLVPDTSVHGANVKTVHRSAVWQQVIGSNSGGAWFNYQSPYKRLSEPPLREFVPVGNHNDSISFWWNKSQLELVYIDSTIRPHTLPSTGVNNLRQVTFSRDGKYVLSSASPFFLDLKKKKVYPADYYMYACSIYATHISDPNNFVVASGFGIVSLKKQADSFATVYRDGLKYDDLQYDSIGNAYYAFNISTLLCMDQTGQKQIYNREALRKLGIQNMENICLDAPHRMLFIKDYEHIVLFDLESHTTKIIFPNIKFTGKSYLFLRGNTLVVVTDDMTLFANVQGKMNVSSPYVFFHKENSLFKLLYGCTILNNHLILSTDRAWYSMPIPDAATIAKNSSHTYNGYRLVASNGGNTRVITANDTIAVKYDDYKLVFDIINPMGNGARTMWVAMGDSTQFTQLTSSEYVLPANLSKDATYNVWVYFSDNTFKSRPWKLAVYLQPRWWETQTATKVIWAGIVLLFLGLIALSAYITRRAVLRSTEKKQLRMELELSAIYSQINPHFIFNTLNSAQMLVSKGRMEEAYAHISKFSKLLRSYLKSSRTKYVLLSDEISNLTNYIELQQTRFRNKFDYSIFCDDDLAALPIKIPSLLLQPFVENAINHGIWPLNNKGMLTINFRWDAEEKMVTCTVRDNGIGRKQAAEQKNEIDENRPSYGNLMMRDLIAIFNRYETMKIHIEYTDLTLPETGTLVTITIRNPQYMKEE